MPTGIAGFPTQTGNCVYESVLKDYPKEAQAEPGEQFKVKVIRKKGVFWVFQVDCLDGTPWNVTPIKDFFDKKEAIEYAEDQ